MSELLRENERIDDLQWGGLKIIQSPDSFRFGLDAVLLADFAAVRPGSRVCDLGTGTGILPLLLWGREKEITCDGVEIQKDAADRAQRTMHLNGLSHRIAIHNRDLKEVRAFLPHAGYDLVICNPPYSPRDSALMSPNPALSAARTEGKCTLLDVIRAAAYLVKGRGRFVFMLPASRLLEACDELRSCWMEPKRLRLVHGAAVRPARLALIDASRDVRPGLSILPPLIVKTPEGNDTEEIKQIYNHSRACRPAP